MLPVGLLLTLSLAIGLVAQSCDVGTFTIDDVRDSVTVTNASPTRDAVIQLSTTIANVDSTLPAGSSSTFNVLAAATYNLRVWAPNDPSGASYRQSLIDLRAELVDLAVNPGDSSATPESAITQLLLVQAALKELHGSRSFQSCSGTIKSGLETQATITWMEPTASGFWVLTCG
jgi:hypothetical protein